VNAISTPGSATYHHYLRPAAYTRRFGASAASARAVHAWLARQGLRGVRTDAQRNYVTATGTVAQLESVFDVTMNRYRVTGPNGRPTVLASNDRPMSVPVSLRRYVMAVTGLNSTKPQAMHLTPRKLTTNTAPGPQCSTYWGEHTAAVQPAFHGITSLPTANCGYSAAQLRAAYSLAPSNVGRGQRVALIELGTPYKMFKTLIRYAQVNGLPAPSSTQYQELAIGQGAACGNFFDIEEQLDSEAVYAMAPAANQLLVGGDTCNDQLGGVQALYDAETTVLNGSGNAPLASIESNSWGITGGETFPRLYQTTAHSILLRAAAEGVTMAFSSGDSPGVSVPAADPYALSVGGTTLGVGQQNQRLFETGWSNDDAYRQNGQWHELGIGRDAAGGNTSLIWSEPSYQKGVVPARMTHVGVGANHTDRAVPDISADADATTGIAQIVIEPGRRGDVYHSFVDGGTSLAAPLVAGMLADAQQGHKRFGFVNPTLYALAGSSAYNDTLPVTSASSSLARGAFCAKALCGAPIVSLFDSQLPQYTDQVTARGYDTMTGIGTPNGPAFIKALRAAH
jgi:subtilase family serine protease